MFSQEEGIEIPHPHPIPSFSPARKKNRSNQNVEPMSYSFSQGIALNFSQSSWIAPANDGETNSNSSKPSQGDTLDFSQTARLNDSTAYYTSGQNNEVISQSMPFSFNNNSNFFLSQENSGPNSNNMSQFSTFSQDFADRLGHLHVRCSQDNNSMAGPPNEDSSFIAPQPRASKPPVAASSKPTNASLLSTVEEKQIELQAPLANPFLSTHTHYNEWYFSRPFLHTSLAYPSKIWISAFKERPRYITDFQELACIGEGNFSQVFAVRHRLDGSLYAIKKNKLGIQTENHLRYLLRETNALAALKSVKGIVGYYGVWLEEGVLYIQMELCAGGSVEDLVSSSPTQGSVMYIERIKRGLGLGGAAAAGGTKGLRVERNRSDSYISDCGGVEGAELFNTQLSVLHPTQGASLPSSPVSNQPTASPKAHEGVSEALAWVLLRGVAEGVAGMHARGLVHLDIRPANIFICGGDGGLFGLGSWWEDQEEGDSKEGAEQASGSLFSAVMLGGGGNSLATPRGAPSTPLFPPPSSSASCSLPPLSSARQALEQHIVAGRLQIKIGDLGHVRGLHEVGGVIEGDSRYCPRELINSDCHALDLTKADIFSLAASVYELCLGRGLGRGGDDGMAEWHSIRDGHLDPHFLDHYSSDLVSLIKAMLHPNAALRPSAIEVISKTMSQQGETAVVMESETTEGSSHVKVLDVKDEYIRQLKEENDRLKNLLNLQGSK